MKQRVLLYAQHILGIGHLVRASRIARALEEGGAAVTVVLGGMRVAGVDWGDARLEQLPPIRASEKGYADLVDENGQPIDDDLRERRRAQLLTIMERVRPDAVLIEAFPFGRRAMRFELIPALELVRSWERPPVVAASIRDILHENRKAHLNQQTAELAERLFDLILVHGDPELIALGASFPEADRIAPMVRYTGLVAPKPMHEIAGEAFDVVVSAGGGAVGQLLLRTALEAMPRSRARDARWLFVTGPNLDMETRSALSADAPSNVSVEEFRSDFVALLHHARLSISQAGYNTAADVLVARCASVMVPSAYQGETEQTRRSHLLAGRGLIEAVEETELTGETLAAAIDKAWSKGRMEDTAIPDLDGAAASARMLLEACDAR